MVHFLIKKILKNKKFIDILNQFLQEIVSQICNIRHEIGLAILQRYANYQN